MAVLLKLQEKYDLAMAENARLKAAMDKYSEDEVLCNETIEQPAQGMVSATPCEWYLDDDDNGIWQTGCGKLWSFIDGGPIENDMDFCHGCGNPVTVATKGGLNERRDMGTGAKA
jgi:hypothetical protein